MRGDSGVAGEGRVVGVPKFHSCGKCTIPLTNINSDWMSNASSGLRIILCYITRVVMNLPRSIRNKQENILLDLFQDLKNLSMI